MENLFLFDGLSEAEKKEIIAGFENPLKFKKGEIIYSKKQHPNALGYLISGKAYAEGSSQKGIYMRSFEKHSCFGVASIFGSDSDYVSIIKAKTDATVLFITEKQLIEIFSKYPQTAVNYIKFLSDKIRFLNKKINVVTSPNAEIMVLNHLKTIMDYNNNAVSENMTLISKTLGIGRATLYRSLDSLESKGLIKRKNNIIRVTENEENY